MTALTDNFLKVAAAGAATYMATPGKAIGATSFGLNSAAGFPTTTACVVAIRTVDAQGNEVSGTYTEWLCTISGTTVSLGSSPSPIYGTDQVYAAGATTQVYIPLSSYRDNRLIDALLQQHTQAGAHQNLTNTGGLTTDTLSVSGSSSLASATATTGSFSGNVTVGGQLQVTGASTTSGSTITPSSQIYDVTALAASATINVPSFTPWNGAPFLIRIVDNGSAQSLTFASGYTNISGLALPTTTVAGKYLTIAGMYNSALSKWQIMGIIQGT